MGTTVDGVDVSGDHLLAEVGTPSAPQGKDKRRGRLTRCGLHERQVEAKITDLGNVDRFSIIGYSMGGLNARYVVGKMLERGHFKTIRPLVNEPRDRNRDRPRTRTLHVLNMPACVR